MKTLYIARGNTEGSYIVEEKIYSEQRKQFHDIEQVVSYIKSSKNYIERKNINIILLNFNSSDEKVIETANSLENKLRHIHFKKAIITREKPYNLNMQSSDYVVVSV